MFTVLFLFSLFVAYNEAQVVGAWHWTWEKGPKEPPVGTTHSFAYAGDWLPETIAAAEPTKESLKGTKIVAVGGPTWTQAKLTETINAINRGVVGNAGYSGIAWELKGGDSGLANAFISAFEAAKAKGLSNWVTYRSTAPIGFKDSAALMKKIFACDKVDYVVPQLYVNGQERGPVYRAAAPLGWDSYTSFESNIKIVPSIISGAMYDAVYCYFAQRGVKISGYVQLKQSGYTGTGPSTPTCKKPVEFPNMVYSCGAHWRETSCAKTCPSGLHSQCPPGQKCFARVGACPPDSANDAIISIESEDGTTTVTHTNNVEYIPGYAVALLVIASLVLVVLLLLILIVATKKKAERV